MIGQLLATGGSDYRKATTEPSGGRSSTGQKRAEPVAAPGSPTSGPTPCPTKPSGLRRPTVMVANRRGAAGYTGLAGGGEFTAERHRAMKTTANLSAQARRGMALPARPAEAV